MSVLTRNRIVREPIPIASGSNRPYGENTIYIQGRGLYQKDLPDRLLYGNRNGRRTDRYATPVIAPDERPIPFRAVTELSRGQRFALEFYQGKAIYEKRKAFADNLSSSGGGGSAGGYGFLGNRQTTETQTFYEPDAAAIAPEFADAEGGLRRSTGSTSGGTGRIVHLDAETQAANPDLPAESISSQSQHQLVGSLPPSGLRATQRVVPLSTINTMEVSATDGSTNETPASSEPADVLRTNIPPRLRDLRPPPSYAAPHRPAFAPVVGIEPEEANRQVGQYLQDHPDASRPPNLMPFPTVNYSQRAPDFGEQVPPGLARAPAARPGPGTSEGDLPVPWRTTLEAALDEDNALAELNIALQNMTLNDPPIATARPRARPVAAVSNLGHATAGSTPGAAVAMPGAYPSAGLSRNPQATEFFLATPRHQARYIPPNRRPRVPGGQGIPLLLQRRSTRVVLPPDRLVYDLPGTPRPARVVPGPSAPAVAPAPVLRRSTRNARAPERTTYDEPGNPTSRRGRR